MLTLVMHPMLQVMQGRDFALFLRAFLPTARRAPFNYIAVLGMVVSPIVALVTLESDSARALFVLTAVGLAYGRWTLARLEQACGAELRRDAGLGSQRDAGWMGTPSSTLLRPQLDRFLATLAGSDAFSRADRVLSRPTIPRSTKEEQCTTAPSHRVQASSPRCRGLRIRRHRRRGPGRRQRCNPLRGGVRQAGRPGDASGSGRVRVHDPLGGRLLRTARGRRPLRHPFRQPGCRPLDGLRARRAAVRPLRHGR